MANSLCSDSPRRRPFMQLDLQNVPKDYNKVTFQQQCYRLVPDLSPEEQRSIEGKDRGIMAENEQSKLQLNGQRRRRRLPEIPLGKKPFEQLWERQMNSAKRANSISVEIAKSLSLGQEPELPPNREQEGHRWTRKLSTNMLLEIETDCLSGKALSLRLINDEPEEEEGKEERDQQTPSYSFSPLTDQSSVYSFITPRTKSEQTKCCANTSDSGVSSNLQSPTVSTNSDSIDFSLNHASTPKNNSLRLPEPTHRALYKFCSRHVDELDLEIGDAVYVSKEHEDHWSEGINIRTGVRGIFPSSLVTDVEYSEFTIDEMNMKAHLFEEDSRVPSINFRIKRERFLLDFLGSIEVNESKGEEVLNEAICRVSNGVKPNDIGMNTPCSCILEVSDIGLRMMDNSRDTKRTPTKGGTLDYYFSLLQITYCGHRTKRENYYFAFVTRHPSDRARFACHVFQAPDTTREVADAVGRAFHRFYNRFIERTLPLETFYLDN